jgi:hypothetical protein
MRKVFELLVSPIIKPDDVAIVEKTPKNCLRIPFLVRLFPDVFFVYLTREPRANISSLMEGWRDEARYQTYQLPGGVDIQGYQGDVWNFLLPPGWHEYAQGARLEEVCAWQYRIANETALSDLEDVPSDRQLRITYEELVANPKGAVQYLCRKIGVGYQGGTKRWSETMRPVNTSSAPASGKWRKNEEAILSVLGEVRGVAQSLGYRV